MSRLRTHRATHRVAPVVLALLTVATGCTSDQEPERVTVSAGDLRGVLATDVQPDRDAAIGLPSGVLSLRFTGDAGTVSTDDSEVSAADGASLVAVAWSLQPHPSSDARDVVLDGGQPADLPDPTLTVVDGPGAIDVPLGAGGSGAVVVGTIDPTALEVTVDGLTQTVDLATGAVATGPAEPFLDLASAAEPVQQMCAARDFPRDAVLDHGCRVEQVYRLPWIAGLGWATGTGSWLVVDARVRGEATVRLGDDEGTTLDSGADTVQRVAFEAGDTAPPQVDFDFGTGIGVVTVPLPG